MSVCPGCGRCRHCGHPAPAIARPYPYPYPDPYPYPWYSTGPIWGTGTITVGDLPNTTIVSNGVTT